MPGGSSEGSAEGVLARLFGAGCGALGCVIAGCVLLVGCAIGKLL